MKIFLTVTSHLVEAPTVDVPGKSGRTLALLQVCFACERQIKTPFTQLTRIAFFYCDSIANSYGLFRRMTGVEARPEVSVEGSADGERWYEFTFKYKPDYLDKQPPVNVPHQPRLDWQMW